MRPSARIALVAILVLVVVAGVIWYASVREAERPEIVVAFLDVGQGDATLIRFPGGAQALIDGGSGTAVLRVLPKHMPWYDRSLDLIVATHADMDHIGGLIDVLGRYRVSRVLVPNVDGETNAWDELLEAVARERAGGAVVLGAMRGERIEFEGAYLEVLFPDRDAGGIETNTGCVVMRLVYGETAFMLPCDAPDEVEKYLAVLDAEDLESEVLKVGHHGSRTSSHPLFVGLVDPEYAVISRGCDNTYGHPAPETIATYERFDIPVLDTCEEGTITFVSDGQTVRRK